MFENKCLNKTVFPNVELRELTPEEIANHKPKGRFQLRAESYKENHLKSNMIYISSNDIKIKPDSLRRILKDIENDNQ